MLQLCVGLKNWSSLPGWLWLALPGLFLSFIFEGGSWRMGLGGRKYRARSCPKPQRQGGVGTLHKVLMPAWSLLLANTSIY